MQIKSFVLLSCGLLLSPALFAVEAPKDLPKEPEVKLDAVKAGTLQVQVVIPPPTRITLEQDLSDAIFTRAMDLFRRRDFKGPLSEVSGRESPSAGSYLVTINLLEWRTTPAGNIDCNFTATLKTETATYDLGRHTGTMANPGPNAGRAAVDNAFFMAADSALSTLFDSIAKLNVVPGLRPRL